MNSTFKMLAPILLLFFAHCVSANNRADDFVQDESFFVQAEDGVKIHYRVVGFGEPVVLIHGYYANEDINWFQNGIAPELTKNYKVIAIDLRGHGKSDKPKKSSAYGDKMWRDIVLVLDALKIREAHFHGYSLGGALLTQILYYQPQKVLSAVFGGSGITEYDKNEKKKIKKDKTPSAVIKEQEEKARNVLLSEDPDHMALYALSKNPPGKGGEAAKIDLKKIKIPVLAINGEYDYPNLKTHRMKRELVNFKSVVLPDKGHLTTITPNFMPKAYLKELVDFLNSL